MPRPTPAPSLSPPFPLYEALTSAAASRPSLAVLPPVPSSTWTPPPSFSKVPPSPVPPAPSLSLSSLPRADLEARLLAAEARNAHYASASRDILNALILAPDMTAMYSDVLCMALRETLSTRAVGDVVYCECSMPSVASGAEAPQVDLVRFDALGDSEWDVDWSPRSWWLRLGVEVGMGLRVDVRVAEVRVRGRVRVGLSKNLSSVRVAFVGEGPLIELGVETSVFVGGVVPIPVRQSVDEGVRAAVSDFVDDNLVGENSMVFVIRDRRPEQDGITKEEVEEARSAAARHAAFTNIV